MRIFILSFLLIYGCQPAEAPVEKGDRCRYDCDPVQNTDIKSDDVTTANSNQDNVAQESPENLEEDTDAGEEIEVTVKLKQWTVREMDQELVVRDPIVGMLDLIGSRVPVLSVDVTRGTSYLQIVRCLSNAKIEDVSTGTTLLDVDQLLDTDKQLEHYLASDFFGIAEVHPDCFLMSVGHNSNTFPDFTAPTGQYVYPIRACLDSSLIIRKRGESSRLCSRSIARSTEFEFVNQRRELELRTLRQAEQSRLKLRGHAIRIDQVARKMELAIDECQKQQERQIAAVRKKQAIARIVGAGINTVANAFVLTKSLGSVAKGGLTKVTQASSLAGKAKAGASLGGSLLGSGMLLGGLFDGPLPQAFVNLTANPTDIPRSCYELQVQQREISRVTQMYANDMNRWLLAEKSWLDASRARFLEEGFSPDSLPDWDYILAEFLEWQETLTPPSSEDGENEDSDTGSEEPSEAEGEN